MIPSTAPGKVSQISASPDKLAIKRESKRLIRAAGGVEAAAMYARPNKTAMGDYGSPNNDRFIPVDAIADLEVVTRGTAGWPIMTRMLATLSNCAVVELPLPGEMSTRWLDEIGQLAEDNAKVSKRLCTAAGDGTVSAKEIVDLDLIAACDEEILHLVNLRARLERIVEEARS